MCYSVLIQMITGPVSNVLRLSVERKSVLPLSQQLRSAVEMAVISGEFGDGTPLPSVRRLAGDLKVAPNTVVRAYSDLQAEGIVQVVPRRGYFVVGHHEQPADVASEALQGHLDEVVSTARQAGLTDKQVLQLVAQRLRSRANSVRRIGIVGRRDAALDERVATLAAGVQDLGVEVIGLSFEELRTPQGQARAAGLDLYLVPVLETEEAAELLGPHANRIMPMNRRLKPSVLAFVAARPADSIFGIIAGADEYRGRMIAALQKIHPLKTPPIVVSVKDTKALDHMIRSVDAILIGSTAAPHMRSRLPLPVPSIEFTYLPDASTIARVRARLMNAAVQRRTDVGAKAKAPPAPTGRRTPVAKRRLRTSRHS